MTHEPIIIVMARWGGYDENLHRITLSCGLLYELAYLIERQYLELWDKVLTIEEEGQEDS